jgi:hypothetical protein
VLLELTLGERVDRALEVGCHDGMVGAALERRGWRATGIDLRTGAFDARAGPACPSTRWMPSAWRSHPRASISRSANVA